MANYEQVKKVLKKSILKKKGIVATGIGYKIINGKQTDELALICSVVKKLPLSEISKQDFVPPTIKGVPTDIVETGLIKALHIDKHRPAPGGVSVGHTKITAGTLGCIVKNNGKSFILSNSHVLACSNDASIGDSILQPGTYDGGTYPNDHIADLFNFVPINFPGESSGCPISKNFTRIINGILSIIGSKTCLQSMKQAEFNLVDAAIARPLRDEDLNNEIMEIGKIEGTKSAILGMKIKKSGRTTGLTAGEIQQIDATVNVQYGENKIATFTDQIIAGDMSAGGDSGSAVLDEDNNIVGLLFAGSDTTTVCNRIENVFELLNVHL